MVRLGKQIARATLGPTFISLIDDTTRAWRDEDFNLLKQQSNVAFWSRKDELERLLATYPPELLELDSHPTDPP